MNAGNSRGLCSGIVSFTISVPSIRAAWDRESQPWNMRNMLQPLPAERTI